MDQKKRRRLVQKELAKTVKEFGFEWHSGALFVRNRGEIQDLFFFQFARDKSLVYIPYGIDCPKLLPELRGNTILKLDTKPSLYIDNGRLAERERFGCWHEEHVVNTALKVAKAIATEANPWFYEFQKKEDFIQRYHSTYVGIEKPTFEVPEGKVIKWLLYGLMLHDIGEASSKNWLLPVLSALKSRRKSAENEEWIRIIESRKL